MIRRYQTRPAEVSAVQWDGNNLTELHDFAGNRFEYRPDPNAEDVAFVQVTPTSWVSLGEDRWVVRDRDGALRVCSPAEFAADYEPVGEAPDPPAVERLTAGWPLLQPSRRNTPRRLPDVR
ncbi:hypothetical protein AB0F88_39910 [Streptosporangium sp. NPDC023963]|uniref:hypothetical protein n=1 Tax=Streptosporangium sp. NPDC023963 TaxID=3155608 RepID=UPI0034233BDD